MKYLKPRLLFIYANQFGYHTDSYKYCEYLKEIYDIIYICFDQGFERVNLQGIETVYMPYNNGKIRRLVHFYTYIIRFTKKNKIDIIFTIQFKLCFLIGLFTKARIKILDYRTGDLSSNFIVWRLKNMLLRFDSLFFKHISAISEGLRDSINLNKSKTLILPLGGDIISAKPHSYDRLDLLYIGSFNLRNIHQTVEGVAMFLSDHKEFSSSISYTIVGFGNTKDVDKIKETIQLKGLSEIVHYVGRKRYTELHNYFDFCNIGVSYVPRTHYYEHQPVTKTFEYANSGLYTIATNTYENCKIINLENGVLCYDTSESFARAIEVIYNRKDKIKDSEIRESLKDFHWEKIVNNILKPYLKSLLAN